MQAKVNVFLVSGQKYPLCNRELQAEEAAFSYEIFFYV